MKLSAAVAAVAAVAVVARKPQEKSWTDKGSRKRVEAQCLEIKKYYILNDKHQTMSWLIAYECVEAYENDQCR